MTLPNALLQAARSPSVYSTLMLDRDGAQLVSQLINAAQELRATGDNDRNHDSLYRALAAIEGHRA
jgi:hypothetical protein